jgi:hypothetical protein
MSPITKPQLSSTIYITYYNIIQKIINNAHNTTFECKHIPITLQHPTLILPHSKKTTNIQDNKTHR